MTFTLADASVTKPTALGDNGGGEGFSGITGIAVSFDTWKNTNDPSNNFVGIATTNSAPAGAELRDHQHSDPGAAQHGAPRRGDHHATGISVTMDGTQVLNYATALPPKVLVGFTAATAGSTTSTRSRTSPSPPVRRRRRPP